MVKLYLLEFIKQQRSNGYADDAIKDFLLKNNYSKEDVDEALKYAASNIAPPQESRFSVLSKPAQQMSPQNPPASPYAKQTSQGIQAVQPKKESHHIGLYVAFLIIILGLVAGALYMNGVFGTPAMTMDQLLSSMPFFGTQSNQNAAPINAPINAPAQPASQTPAAPAETESQQQNASESQNPAIPEINQTAANQTSAPEVVIPAAPVIPSDYKTYKSANFGYQFSYPKNWNLSLSVDEKTITLALPAYNDRYLKNEIKVHANILTPSISTLQSFTTWIYTQFAFTGMTGISYVLAGKDGYSLQKSISSKVGTDVLTKKYMLLTGVNNNIGYYVYYIALNSDYDKSISDVNTFVSSFKYI